MYNPVFYTLVMFTQKLTDTNTAGNISMISKINYFENYPATNEQNPTESFLTRNTNRRKQKVVKILTTSF